MQIIDKRLLKRRHEVYDLIKNGKIKAEIAKNDDDSSAIEVPLPVPMYTDPLHETAFYKELDKA